MNAIAPVAMGFGEMERLAVSIAKSNLFGIRTPEQALVLMSIAQAEGRHPALAARDYDIVQNRPAKRAEAMLRDFLEGGGKVEWHTLSDDLADATFSHAQGGTVRIAWDMERAAKAGLAKKENYKSYPLQMLRSRCVSEGVRTVWPSATSGMHVPEEAADMPAKEAPHDGPTIEHEAPQTARDKQAAETYGTREAVNQSVPMGDQPKRTRGQFLDGLEIAMRECGSLDEVNKLIAHPDTQRAMQTFQNGHKARLDGIIAQGIGAHAPVQHEEADDSAWPGPDPAEMRREREAAGA